MMNWECQQTLGQGLEEDDKLATESPLSPIDCMALCDNTHLCRSVQVTNNGNIGICNLYKAIAPEIPPLSSNDTLFDYYCFKGRY